MADKQVQAPTVEAADVLEKARGFWAKYSKNIIIAGSVLIVVMGAYLGYKYFFKLPKEQKASELVFPAEKLFGKMATTSSYNKDTVNIVLNGGNLGGETITGLLKIISNYGGTPAGNRARYMVGACYLQMKEFDKAISQLKEFDGNGASQIQSKAYILLGHAYSELKKTDEAMSYYKKAASVDEKDEGMTTEALFIAARYAEATGNTKEAIEIFQKLKDEYPASLKVMSGDVDKYLAKLGVTK
jgi:tetratricopeptide (TPR) repeat protein